MSEYMIIDGVKVELNGERNILEVAKKAGIDIPAFCYDSDLAIYGACRMCMFEDERGRLDASCSAQPRDGMVIKTNTEKLRKYRKNILELLLASHCRDCTTCSKSTNCKLQEFAKRYKLDDVRFPNTAKTGLEDNSSCCIVKDPSKCILCGLCVRMCNDTQNVGAIDFAHRGSNMTVSTAFEQPLAKSPCVGCGQCAAVCPTGAITIRNDENKVWSAINDKEVKTTIQIAPAVRVAIGKELGATNGENVMGKIVASLRRMGFDEVYDTTIGADLTVLEETNEFIERLQNNGKLPLFTSCCPGWIQYAEKKHPELLENISTCRSPMQMLASILKYDAKKKGEKTFHVAVMPCTAKKFEAERKEFYMDGNKNVDAVISTQELISMIQQAGIVFSDIAPEEVDSPLDIVSGAGVIFGVTGGVTEAVLRRVVAPETDEVFEKVATMGERGKEGIKSFEIPYGDKTLRIGVVSGLANAEKIINDVKNGEKYDLIEVMACPGGCINGGGQPISDRKVRCQRSKGLYKADEVSKIRNAQDNPLMKELYEKIDGKTHELLHVHYGK